MALQFFRSNTENLRETGATFKKASRPGQPAANARHCDRSDSLCLPNQVGGLLSDHDASRHRVPGRDARHDRGVGDTQAVHAVDAELAVNDGHFIAAHFGRAGLMPKGGYRVSRETLELAPF